MTVVDHSSLAVFIVPLIIALLLLVLSTIARWHIFSATGHRGFLSIIPIANIIVYGKIADRLRAAIGILLLSFGLSLMGSVYSYALLMPVSLPRSTGTKVLAVCTVVLILLVIASIVLYISLLVGLCNSLSLPKAVFIPLFLLFLPLAEILTALTLKRAGGGAEPYKNTHSGTRTASLEPCLSETEDDYLTIWHSGAVVFPEDLE